MATYSSCHHVTAECPVSASPFGYKPSLPANAILLSIFSVVVIAQLLQGVGWKTWGFLTAFVLGSLFEVMGYAGRLILHSNPWSYHGFVLQMYCLTVAPGFLSAGLYLCYSRLVESYNKSISRISPGIFPMISTACNILPFILQMSGAIIISNEVYSGQDLTRGKYLIISGLAFQMLTLVLFGLLCADYTIRAHRQTEDFNELAGVTRSTKRFRYFWVALSCSVLFVLIRCIYLVNALASGWQGGLMHNEIEFIILDGVMVLAAAYAMSLVHPGYVFQQTSKINEKNTIGLANE